MSKIVGKSLRIKVQEFRGLDGICIQEDKDRAEFLLKIEGWEHPLWFDASEIHWQ